MLEDKIRDCKKAIETKKAEVETAKKAFEAKKAELKAANVDLTNPDDPHLKAADEAMKPLLAGLR